MGETSVEQGRRGVRDGGFILEIRGGKDDIFVDMRGIYLAVVPRKKNEANRTLSAV